MRSATTNRIPKQFDESQPTTVNGDLGLDAEKAVQVLSIFHEENVMQRTVSQYSILNVLGFAVGSGLAGFILRLLIVPAGLGRTPGVMIAEGDFGSYAVRALVLGIFSGLAGAIIAFVHNEFAKRS